MAPFVGLRLHPDGRLDAHLKEGTVQLQPTLEDLERRPGWYTFDWTPARDPTVTKLNSHTHDAGLPRPFRNSRGQFQKRPSKPGARP